MMESKMKNVILIIADISGYTRFMMTNKTSLIHSQVIITKLIRTLFFTYLFCIANIYWSGIECRMHNRSGWEECHQ